MKKLRDFEIERIIVPNKENKIKKHNIIIMELLRHKGFPNIWKYLVAKKD
jgi:hypothetical protein